MNLRRRELLVAGVGFGVGGALATATGLGAYYVRRSRRLAKPSVRQVRRKPSDSALDNWVLTDADRQTLVESDGLPQSQTLEILDNVDIPGAGDLRAEDVSSVSQCVAACEADDQCNAFTFARLSHPIDNKRHKCWLKSEKNPQRRVTDINYISGLKP